MAQKQPLYTLLLVAMEERAQQLPSSHRALRELMEFGEMLKHASDINENHRAHIAFRLRVIAGALSNSSNVQGAQEYLDDLHKEFC